MNPFTRRTFFAGAAAAAATTTIGIAGPVTAESTPRNKSNAFLDVQRGPDSVHAYLEDAAAHVSLVRQGALWQTHGVEVRVEPFAAGTSLIVLAPKLRLTRIHLRWSTDVDSSLLILGDAWERSYGDLAWRTLVPERVLPWYFAAHHEESRLTHGYGVMTGAGAFCFWQVDAAGVSLWIDVSNGGMGVLLSQRELHAATIVSRSGHAAEHPADAVAALCKLMCPHPRLPNGPVFGTNDWYYAYGNNTAAGILRDTGLVVSLSPPAGPRPFSVIDDGWRNEARFPDMAGLASKIRDRGARPGIWIRPTLAPAGTRPELLLAQKHFRAPGTDLAYDPTIPEALHEALETMKQVVGWKYELVKHDFSTYDLLGQWGFEMGASPATSGWSFHDRSRTNAEIILDYYKALRSVAGEGTLLLGCNTVSHLAAGVFEMQRTGDDTSGKIWERTRRMGVNTLAFRLPQDRTFYSLDADCVGITNAIPWEMNRQWLDLLARSGTGLFISPGPDAIGPEQRTAIKEAFGIAAADASRGRATDWFHQTAPEQWAFTSSEGGRDRLKRFDWLGEEGAFPYTV